MKGRRNETPLRPPMPPSGETAQGDWLSRLKGHARARTRNDRPLRQDGSCVVYWMQRSQRGFDNPALDAAVFAANEMKLPLAVFLAPVPFFPRATERAYSFLFEGIDDVRADVEARGATFVFRTHPRHRIDEFAREVNAALVIGDENPLKETEAWRTTAAARLDVPLITIDADVVVPTSLVPNEEWAAYTIRPKIHRLLPTWLVTKPEQNVSVTFSKRSEPRSDARSSEAIPKGFPLDSRAPRSERYHGGSRAGRAALQNFLEHGLAHYPDTRNKPELEDGTSRLSMYLHFGHLGPRHVALAVMTSDAHPDARAAFLEQLIVRRELAINFVLRNPKYDEFACAAEWAVKTLTNHRHDERPYSLSKEQLELGKSPDPLWNAAQNEMRLTGYMHNHMRMYWGKKLLEWMPSPEEAYALAIEFNDRYELDGRDPNGYAGIAWAIAGKHDRPFAPGRSVFGTIRPMTLASTGRKFDSKRYIAGMEALARTNGTT